MQDLNAEVISIGTEILLGEITDTNSTHIARSIRDIGLNLYFMTTVGDNEIRIASAIQNALERAHIVIVCGGLGPTVDDVTRQAVATATERKLVFHKKLLNQIAARFASFHVKMTDNNRQQAYLPEEAHAIENPVGTAPAFIVEHNERVVIALPGVPREMKFLMSENVIPFLRERYNLGVIKTRILQTAGIGESSLDNLIRKDILEQSNPTVGLAAHSGNVDVRIAAKADSTEEAEQMIDITEAKLRKRVGTFIFGTGTVTLERVLVDLMQANHVTISITETGIGTPISARIRSVGEGETTLATTATYDHPEDLQSALSTDKDISLRALSLLAAETSCKQSGSIAGVAVVSQPDVDENADTEQGTAVAVYTKRNTYSRIYGFGGQSDLASVWVSTWAMAKLWRMLKEKFGDE